MQCDGQLSVGLVGRTAAAAKTQLLSADITSIFLQPGSWGRFKNLPIRLDAVAALKEIGVSLIRVGGSFAIADWYFWKHWRGPVWERPPASWQDSLVSGLGPFEMLDLATALDIEFVYYPR